MNVIKEINREDEKKVRKYPCQNNKFSDKSVIPLVATITTTMKGRAFIILCICLAAFICASGQVKIIILDPVSRSILPNTTVVNLNKKTRLHADAQGMFSREWSDTDSILVTHDGYFDRAMLMGDIIDDTIHLNSKTKVRSNSTAIPCTDPIKQEYCSFNKTSGSSPFNGISWSDDDGLNVAVMVRPGKKVYLSTIQFVLIKSPNAPEKMMTFPTSRIRFSFYSIDSVTQLPSDLLTSKTIDYIPERLGMQTIKAESLAIITPVEGFYIMVDYLVAPADCATVKYINELTGKPMSYKNFNLMFDGASSTDFRPAHLNHKTGEWKFYTDKEQEKPGSTIKFGITFYSCK